MMKVGRNDACPCGSGKKYKKCHGATNVVEITTTPYNHKLDELHKGFINYALKEYRLELEALQNNYLQNVTTEDKKLKDRYLTGVAAWGMLHQPIQGDETIFDHYYKKERNKVKDARTRQTFAVWKEVTPSIYKIRSVTEDKEHLLDVWTNEEYAVSRPASSESAEGDMLVGILLPYVNDYRFLYRIPATNDKSEQEIKNLKTWTNSKPNENFPDRLAELLMGEPEMDSEPVASADPQYKLVEDIYREHATAKNVEEEIISAGTKLWSMYTEKTSPTVRKPEAFAAAIDYVVHKDLSMGAFQSQNELAEEYGVSSTTISKHRRNIADVLAEEITHMLANFAEA